jgi:hypothetical protein
VKTQEHYRIKNRKTTRTQLETIGTPKEHHRKIGGTQWGKTCETIGNQKKRLGIQKDNHRETMRTTIGKQYENNGKP